MARHLVVLVIAASTCLGDRHAQEPTHKQSDADCEFSAMDAALEDLLSWKESPLRTRRGVKKQLVFSRDALSRKLDVDEVVRYLHAKQWRELSPGQLQLVRDAAADLVSRVSAIEPFKEFKPKDERIVIPTEDLVNGKPRRDQPQVFHAYAPGYSRDRQVAIICLTFPWSKHSGGGTYVLERREGKWVVLLRDFWYLH
jgi:hypothetical protein